MAIRRHPLTFLIISLSLLYLVYLSHVVYKKYLLNNWYDYYVDKSQTGLRVFYYPNTEFNGDYVRSEVVKRLSSPYPEDKRFKRNNFSLRAIGVFSTPKTGHYKFFLRSDDGSRLYIDQKLVVDNNFSIHPSEETAKTISLKRGRHLVVIEYFQGYGRAELDFSWLKTVEGKRAGDLSRYYHPIINGFQPDINVSEFQEIIIFPNNIYICLFFAVILVWVIMVCGRGIYYFFINVFSKFENHPLVKSIPLLLVFISGILIYKGVIFSTGPTFQVHDIQALVFPKYYFIRKAFMEWQIPFWDPYTMLGQTGIFSMGLGLFYLPLLGFLSLGFLGPLLPRHFELFIVLHLLFSGITMYLGARRLGLGKLGACLSGIIFQMAIINRDTMYSAPVALGLPWIPLALCFGISLFQKRERLFPRKIFFITIISLALIISTTYPNIIVYTFLTLGIAMAFYIISRIIERDWISALRIFIRGICILLLPLVLTSFITLPGYAALKESIRHNAQVMKFGPLYLPFVWTLFFPRFANHIEPPFAYTGVITFFLVVLFCITKARDKKNEGVLFAIIAIFWFYYAVQDSPLERVLSYLPVLKNMRLSQFGLIVYVFAISIMAGIGSERIYRLQDYRVRLNINWLFPVFILFMLKISLQQFLSMLNHGFKIGSIGTLYFACIFIFCLIVARSNILRVILSRLIPVGIMIEVFISSPPFVNISNAEKFSPYNSILERHVTNFPMAFMYNDLYRIENFGENTIVDYYFGKYSTYGYYAQGTQLARYYYLWNRFAKTGLRYEKWYLPSGITPIFLDSKLYDLMGVKYFYLPEHEWLFVDYRESGKGEWLEVELEEKVLASGIGIYNPPDREGFRQRRILRASIVFDGRRKIYIDIPDETGWHRFFFKPLELCKVRIIAEEVLETGSVGAAVGEIELIDIKGNKIDMPVKDITASSTMVVSSPNLSIDNRLDTVWESRCSVIASKTLSSKTLERVGDGCYINKDVLPRAFMVHRYRYTKNRDELLQELHSEEFNPKETILLEGETVEFDIPYRPYEDNVEITGYKLNEVAIMVKNDKPGFLILTDMYSQGWQVFVDGKKGKLLIADGVFRGIYISKGEHKVLFKYSPPLFKLGSAISLLTAVIIVVLLIFI